MAWIEIIRKNTIWREKLPANGDLKSRCDWETASKWEKNIMKNIPGINHFNIFSSSIPAPNKWLSSPEKRKRKRMNKKLRLAFSNKEEDATAVFSSPLPPTNFICAFFRRLDLAVSNKVVTTKNKAHTPISGFCKCLIRITKLASAKSVMEKRWRSMNTAERIQYDDKYFFKRVSLFY